MSWRRITPTNVAIHRRFGCGSAPRTIRLRRPSASGALASRRSTAALARLLPLTQLRAALPGITGRKREDPPRCLAASTLQASRIAGRYDARSRPGAKLRVSPAGTALAPSVGRHPLTPLHERALGAVTISASIVNDIVTSTATYLSGVLQQIFGLRRTFLPIQIGEMWKFFSIFELFWNFGFG